MRRLNAWCVVHVFSQRPCKITFKSHREQQFCTSCWLQMCWRVNQVFTMRFRLLWLNKPHTLYTAYMYINNSVVQNELHISGMPDYIYKKAVYFILTGQVSAHLDVAEEQRSHIQVRNSGLKSAWGHFKQIITFIFTLSTVSARGVLCAPCTEPIAILMHYKWKWWYVCTR